MVNPDDHQKPAKSQSINHSLTSRVGGRSLLGVDPGVMEGVTLGVTLGVTPGVVAVRLGTPCVMEPCKT